MKNLIRICGSILTILFLLIIQSSMVLAAQDTTKPVIKYFYTPTAANGTKDVRVEFTISEKAKVTVGVYKGTKLVKLGMNKVLKNAGSVSWNWQGKKTDGAYTIKVDVIDLAGNKAVTKSANINIDSSAPSSSNISLTDNTFAPDGSKKLKIKYTTKETANVSVMVYEFDSKKYFDSLKSGSQKAGNQEVLWNGCYQDYPGVSVPSGKYFIKVKISDQAGNKLYKDSPNFTIVNKKPVVITGINLSNYFEPTDGADNIASLLINKNANLSVEVYKKETGKETLIKSLLNKSAKAGYQSVDWDGKTSTGALITAGTYYLKITAVDGEANKVTMNSEDFIVPILYGVGGQYSFKPTGSSNYSLNYNLLDTAKVKVTIALDDEFIKRETLGSKTKGKYVYYWDGKDDAGNIVKSGKKYTIWITAEDSAGEEVSQDVVVYVAY